MLGKNDNPEKQIFTTGWVMFHFYFACLNNEFLLFLQNYAESVPQDLGIGREVMRISATDVDDGNNSIVLYDLEPRMPEDVGYFRVDRNTGVIYLSKNIDVSFLNII